MNPNIKDLLDLMDSRWPESAEFRKNYPHLRILEPTAFLNETNSNEK